MRWMLAAVAAIAALSFPVSALAGVKVKEGRIAPAGLALVSGKMPKAHKVKPKAFVLSKDKKFGAGDVALGAKAEKAAKGAFKAWISMPGDLATGTFRLLACSKSKPAKKTCWAVGSAVVRAAPALRTATPVLDPSRTRHAVIDRRGGSVAATAADGTKFTVTIPAGTTDEIDVTLTPVTALNPASAAGKLIDGVMIDPAGGAPPGATLRIDAARTPSSTTHVVGFGGVDPSGAAFPMPVAAVKHTTIALEWFGGYGIAAPAPPGAARAPLACPRATLSAGPQPIVNCLEVARRTHQQADALKGGRELDAATGDALGAAEQALEGEIQRIVGQPPSDEGAAELEVLLAQSFGTERQAELSGFSDGMKISRLVDAGEYMLNLARAHCGLATDSNEVVAWGYSAFFLVRQFVLLGADGLDNQAFQTFQQCMLRARFEVDVTNDSVASGDDLDLHVNVSADHVPVVVKPAGTFAGVELSSDPATLDYSASDVSVNTPFNSLESAVIKTTGGTVILKPTTLDAQTKVLCENGHLHLQYVVHLWLRPYETWNDTQTVTKSFTGGSSFDSPQQTASAAWGEAYGVKAPAFPLLTDDKTKVTKDSGGDKKCNPPASVDPNCHYSFSATFLARPLPPGG